MIRVAFRKNCLPHPRFSLSVHDILSGHPVQLDLGADSCRPKPNSPTVAPSSTHTSSHRDGKTVFQGLGVCRALNQKQQRRAWIPFSINKKVKIKSDRSCRTVRHRPKLLPLRTPAPPLAATNQFFLKKTAPKHA